MAASRIGPEPLHQDPSTEPEATAHLRRAEVRDVLAWLRLLLDPQDAAAVVRALTRPPIELRQAHLARVIQLARRRKLDLVSGLAAATESPRVPLEARERIERFVQLHSRAAGGLEKMPADAFVAELIELLGRSGRPLLAPEDAAAQQASLRRLLQDAHAFVRSHPNARPRELARHLAVAQPRARAERPSPLEESATVSEELSDDSITEAFQLRREEVLESVARIGGRLGELRLDTELDIAHGVVRYLELVKLAALLQRPPGQPIPEAIADVNARLLAATTPMEREIFQSSMLDDALIGEIAVGQLEEGSAGGAGERPLQGDAARKHAVARSRFAQEGHSLGPFLPRRGIGVALSASDIATYRSCPLRYKYARVLRIPTEQTLHQRFGIAIHQVLERYHATGGQTLEQMLDLLDAGWRRGGFGDEEQERRLYDKGRAALTRYHARLGGDASEPVWFERSFDFRLGPHHLRGRVDRIDRVGGSANEEHELIDYKTSRPKTPEQLANDLQLSLYALAAREAWGLEPTRQAYYYVLDDCKVPVSTERDAAWVRDAVLEVGEGILGQEFEPTPSQAACSICDYRIVCPVAER